MKQLKKRIEMKKHIHIKSLVSTLVAAWVMTSATQVNAQTNQCLHSKISGSGDSVLLMPGFVSDERVWDEIANELSQHYQVHQLSIAGFGKQPACDRADNIYPEIVSQLKKYLTNKQLNNPVYIGHSMGGLLGLNLSTSDIEQLKGVISVGGLPFIGPIFTRSNLTQVKDLTAQVAGIKAMYLNSSPSQMAQMSRQSINIQISDPNRQNTIIEMAGQSDPITAASAIASVMSTDLRRQIVKTQTPTLIIGASGAYNNDAQKEQAQALYQAQVGQSPKLTLKMNTQGRHFLMWDQKDWLIDTIKTFIKDNS